MTSKSRTTRIVKQCCKWTKRVCFFWTIGFIILLINEVRIVLNEEQKSKYKPRDPIQAKSESKKFFKSYAYQNHTDYVTWLTNDTLTNFLQENENAFIDFFATWCGHSQKLYPTWFDFAKAVQREELPVAIGALACDREPNVCEKLGVQGFPNLKWFINGTESFPKYNWGRKYIALLSYTKEKLQNQTKIAS
mmetsp:Transcript_21744/g.30287  ORF Transcript_21744/g.30287 Transcript_21744/m.30287 type:complete len:192 (-) Transcript_21744:133-708(-)